MNNSTTLLTLKTPHTTEYINYVKELVNKYFDDTVKDMSPDGLREIVLRVASKTFYCIIANKSPTYTEIPEEEYKKLNTIVDEFISYAELSYPKLKECLDLWVTFSTNFNDKGINLEFKDPNSEAKNELDLKHISKTEFITLSGNVLLTFDSSVDNSLTPPEEIE